MINDNSDRLLISQDSNELFSSLDSVCRRCFDGCGSESEVLSVCDMKIGKRRRGLVKNDSGSVYYCTGDRDEIKSSRIFKSKIGFYFKSMKGILEIKDKVISDSNKNTNRLVHNLVSLNAKNIQEVHALLPDLDAFKSYKEKVSGIESLIHQNPKEFAMALGRIAKNNMAMKAEFSVYNKLFVLNSLAPLNKKPHPIKKALLSVLHVFSPDLNDHGVYFSEIKNTFDANMDYETFQVAMYHFFDNAAKYTLRDTAINISLSDPSKKEIIVDMVSMKIEDDDFDLLYDDGYSGIYPRSAGKCGKGVGMGLIRKLLGMNDISFEIIRCFDGKQDRLYEGVFYCANRFVMRFE